jgi:hypothetical protein
MVSSGFPVSSPISETIIFRMPKRSTDTNQQESSGSTTPEDAIGMSAKETGFKTFDKAFVKSARTLEAHPIVELP